MEHIDWLIKGEDSTATEEELDMPYALLDGRIYTRREFEEIRDRAQEIEECLSNALTEKSQDDERLFVENIDYIMAHSDLIFADEELSSSSPIYFGIIIRWVGGRTYNLGEMLRSWLRGNPKHKCSECGESAYLFRYRADKGHGYCPHCKKIVEICIQREEREKQVSEIFAIRRAKKEEDEKRRAEAEKKETAAKTPEAESKQRKISKEDEKIHSFGEVDKLWKKYEQIPREEFIAQARLGMAEHHGWYIGYWQRQIEEDEARLKECEDIKQGRKLSDVGKFLARVKELVGE